MSKKTIFEDTKCYKRNKQIWSIKKLCNFKQKYAILTYDGDVYIYDEVLNKITNDQVRGIKDIEFRWDHLMMLSNEQLFFYGSNSYGQFGHLSTKSYISEVACLPNEILNSKREVVTHMANCFSFNIIVTDHVNIYLLGQNWIFPQQRFDDNQFYRSYNAPTIPSDRIIKVEGGSFHCLILTQKGKVLSGGDTLNNKLCRQNSKPNDGFKFIDLKEEIIDICCGPRSSIVMTVSNQVYYYGSSTTMKLCTNNIDMFGASLSSVGDNVVLIESRGEVYKMFQKSFKHVHLRKVEKSMKRCCVHTISDDNVIFYHKRGDSSYQLRALMLKQLRETKHVDVIIILK
ncbi:hypothetical protein AKO1_011301 [Acrasis kona]|uniref:Uncharacterized protein n=1 Tax=Acrasis kona TaxID=1008807 RepID=A0AAW2YXI3_9EUKA